jgi:uncharacterized protein YbjT (DUF2867 family)
MVILITGATGFIGRHLVNALQNTDHIVWCAVRNIDEAKKVFPQANCFSADFTQDFNVNIWLRRMRRIGVNIDVVINTVGIIAENNQQNFSTLHTKTPQALFAACSEAGVKKIIQISALGADDDAQSKFHRSKKEADDFLRLLPIQSIILHPSLVFGMDGASTRLFLHLARLPVLFLPDNGRQWIQPVHIHDVVQAVVNLIHDRTGNHSVTIPVVGPHAVRLYEYLDTLRLAMGFKHGVSFKLPEWIINLSEKIPGISQFLDRETLAMLNRGNTADSSIFKTALHRPPRAISQFISYHEGKKLARDINIALLTPVLRSAIALMWIITGIVSLGLFPVNESLSLLARTGIHGTLAWIMLYGAACLDIILGFATWFSRQREWLWRIQIGLIILYTLIISFQLPEFWLHPYGPVLKNIPLLAAILLLRELEKK